MSSPSPTIATDTKASAAATETAATDTKQLLFDPEIRQGDAILEMLSKSSNPTMARNFVEFVNDYNQVIRSSRPMPQHSKHMKHAFEFIFSQAHHLPVSDIEAASFNLVMFRGALPLETAHKRASFFRSSILHDHSLNGENDKHRQEWIKERLCAVEALGTIPRLDFRNRQIACGRGSSPELWNMDWYMAVEMHYQLRDAPFFNLWSHRLLPTMMSILNNSLSMQESRHALDQFLMRIKPDRRMTEFLLLYLVFIEDILHGPNHQCVNLKMILNALPQSPELRNSIIEYWYRVGRIDFGAQELGHADYIKAAQGDTTYGDRNRLTVIHMLDAILSQRPLLSWPSDQDAQYFALLLGAMDPALRQICCRRALRMNTPQPCVGDPHHDPSLSFFVSVARPIALLFKKGSDRLDALTLLISTWGELRINESASDMERMAEQLDLSHHEVNRMLVVMRDHQREFSKRHKLLEYKNSKARDERAVDEEAERNPDGEPKHPNEVCICCLTNKRRVVFTSCGHICICLACNKRLQQRACPMCKVPIASYTVCYL